MSWIMRVKEIGKKIQQLVRWVTWLLESKA